MYDSIVCYALVIEGKIDAKTIGPTRQFVILNALVSIFNVVARQGVSDETLEKLWKFQTDKLPEGLFKIIEVSVSPLRQTTPKENSKSAPAQEG